MESFPSRLFFYDFEHPSAFCRRMLFFVLVSFGKMPKDTRSYVAFIWR